MRLIKFRGKTFRGQIVFGSYYYENLDDIGEIHSIIDEHGEENIVDPETVAQLVGYDANGKEVYEGDTVVDSCGGEWKAVIYSSLALPSEADNYSLTVYGNQVTLKEDKQ